MHPGAVTTDGGADDLPHEPWLGTQVRCYPDRVRTLVEALDQAHDSYGDRVAVEADGHEVSYSELAELVEGAAERLDLKQWVASRMAGYAVPRYVRVVDAIPRNRTGKADKPDLRHALLAELNSRPRPGSARTCASTRSPPSNF